MSAKPAKTKPVPTKPATILKHLRQKNGATLAALEKVTGWQPHSVRAALNGLRKKGYVIERTKDGKGVTVYRVAE
jgi:predicted transcriptional regulator